MEREYLWDITTAFAAEETDAKKTKAKGSHSASKVDFLRRKAHKVLMKAEDLPLTHLIQDEPTSQLLIYGCSSGSSVSTKQLEAIFSTVQGFRCLQMPIGKPYALALFRSSVAAERAFKALNDKHNPHINKYLILEYSKFLPAKFEGKVTIDGLMLLSDLLSEEEEREVLEEVEKQPCQRKVQHYGYQYCYETNDVDPNLPIGSFPPFVQKIVDKIMATGVIEHLPDQLTINQYYPGAGIPAHVDTHSVFEGQILSLSLGSAYVMDFRHPQEGTHVSLPLPPRSLLVLTGEARYVWSHGITARKTDSIDGRMIERQVRTSFTFRKIRREGDCKCKYKNITWQCDTWLSQHSGIHSRSVQFLLNVATRTEQKYVYEAYENIAELDPHFVATRHKPWPKIQEFLDSQPIVCDLGCAHGKYLSKSDSLYKVGIDTCKPLLSIARELSFEVTLANCLILPFRCESFDLVLSIAVIHHLSTREHRLRSLLEMARILRPGGKLLVYVRAMEQEKRKFKQQDVFVPWKSNEKFKTQEGIQPKIEEKRELAKTTFQRFYHVFVSGELEKLLTEVPRMTLLDSGLEHNSWFILAEKNKGIF